MLNQATTKNLPGAREVLEDIQEIRRRFAASLSKEEVLELIKDWQPEDRLRGLAPEDRLKGLSPEERERLRQLLLR